MGYGKLKRKPTRRDLLVVIGALQDLIGQAIAAHGNDRNPDGFEQGMDFLASGSCSVCGRFTSRSSRESNGTMGAVKIVEEILMPKNSVLSEFSRMDLRV